jgi:hypothetical protein
VLGGWVLMRVLILAIAAMLTAFTQPAARSVPVVLELFTSEGCSSCPPADAVLSNFARRQPVAGVEIIALGMHVTYWDQLGWKDPFSLPLATARQQEYGRVFGEDRIYTPQAVIDGQAEVIGSADAGVRKAIEDAAKRPHTRIALEPTFSPKGISAAITIPAVPPGITEPMDLLFFVTEGGLTSEVKRGENHGHTLRHDAVVRDMVRVGTLRPGDRFPFVATAVSKIKDEPLRPANTWLVVAILQGQKSKAIWASGIR